MKDLAAEAIRFPQLHLRGMIDAATPTIVITTHSPKPKRLAVFCQPVTRRLIRKAEIPNTRPTNGQTPGKIARIAKRLPNREARRSSVGDGASINQSTLPPNAPTNAPRRSTESHRRLLAVSCHYKQPRCQHQRQRLALASEETSARTRPFITLYTA